MRELKLASVLPVPCATPPINELRLRGLGDFATGTSDSLSIAVAGGMPDSAALSLPRATRVISLEGLGPTGLVGFGRTAPMDLPMAWDTSGADRVIAVAFGEPNSFCSTSSLSYARAEHRATLLADGSVLLSGGYDRGGFPVAALERYLPSGDADNAVARFEPMGANVTLESTAVLGHDVTVLADGRALLSGGAPVVKGATEGSAYAEGIAYQGASVLTPLGAFDGAARVLAGGPRAFHAGVRLTDGRALLTGGCSELAKGQCAAGRLQSSVVIYDPQRDTFTAAQPLLVPRAWHRAVQRDDGMVILIGGIGENGEALSPELYDPDESRGTTLTGPAGTSVSLASGMIVALSDAAGASDRVLAWSGRDEAPQPLTQLADARAEATMTVLEDGTVLVAGGQIAQAPSSDSFVIGPSGHAERVSGFAAYGHSATLLRDGSVLLAGGIDSTRHSSATAAVFLRSLTGPFETPATLAFDGRLMMSPSRPRRVAITDGVLSIDGGTTPSRTIESFALLPGPFLAGPSATGFTVSLLAGATGDVDAALMFGDLVTSRYVAVLFGAGGVPRAWSVSPDRPGLPVVEEVGGCEATRVEPDELPVAGAAAFTLVMRGGTMTLSASSRSVLACPMTAAPARGVLAVGARTRTSGGTVRFDNLQLSR